MLNNQQNKTKNNNKIPHGLKEWLKKSLIIFSLASLMIGGIAGFSSIANINNIKSQAAGPSYTTGNKKFFKDGQEIVLKGTNWFGFETDNAVVHGLWNNRSADSMLDQMKSLGFNAVRLPVCPGVLTNKAIGGVNFAANPDFNNLNSQQALDLMMQKMSAKGMYILLDHHRPDCNAISEYWYTGAYSEAQWITDLKVLATRYASNPNFVGLDIKNEPHGAVTWNEWKGATERAGQAILGVNPNIVIYTEGVSTTNAGGNCNSSYNAWWGGNIKGQLCSPISTAAIPANKLAFAPHVYGPDVYGQPYFTDPSFANMPAIWDDHFGGVQAAGYSVALGEFGGKYGAGDSRDVAWQNKVVDYQIAKGMCSFFFWSWNPNSGDTGGILNDDWTTVSTAKYNNVKRLMDAPACQGGAVASSSSSVTSSVSSPTVSSASSVPATSSTKLLDYAKAKGIKLGAAIKNEYLGEAAYVNTATSEFDSFTSEYAMKPDQWWNGAGNYNFTEGDKLADLAKSKGIQMRGHTAIWYQTEPGWLSGTNLTTQQYKDLLRQGVYDYVKHYTDKYPGMFYAWDVVNEMIQDGTSGAIRNNFWYGKLGSDMFATAFQAARDASPTAKLVINDYYTELPGPKANGLLNLVTQLKQSGVPIDGVGFQGHFETGNLPDLNNLVTVMNQFKALGLQVELTEIDMRAGDQTAKAARTYDAIKACLTVSCKSITFWGVTDKYSWLGNENGLLFDANYQPKAMYTQAVQAFRDFGTVVSSSSSAPVSSSSVVSSAPTSGTCYQVTTNRQMGGDNWYNLELKLKNTATTALTNWELSFDLPSTQTVQSTWNNSYSQNGRTVKVTIPGSSIASNEIKDLGGLTIVNAAGTSNTLPTVFGVSPNLCPVALSSSSSTVSSLASSSSSSVPAVCNSVWAPTQVQQTDCNLVDMTSGVQSFSCDKSIITTGDKFNCTVNLDPSKKYFVRNTNPTVGGYENTLGFYKFGSFTDINGTTQYPPISQTPNITTPICSFVNDFSILCQQIDSSTITATGACGTPTQCDPNNGYKTGQFHFGFAGFQSTYPPKFGKDSRNFPVTINPALTSSSSSTTTTTPRGNLKVKVNLQGAYNTGTSLMRTDLKNKNLISNDNPYDDSILASPAPTSTANAVDWVQVIVRETGVTGGIYMDDGGLLLSDGSIIVNPLNMGATTNTRTLKPGKYKVTIKHRNHLAITTNTDIDIIDGQTTTLDFTTNQNVKGSNQAMLKPGVYGLKMGNANGNNAINSLDRILVRSGIDRANFYSPLDINMDGDISSRDRILSRTSVDGVEVM